MKNIKYISISVLLYTLVVFLAGCSSEGCNQKKERTQREQDSLSLTKDTLRVEIIDPLTHQRIRDSTDIYGKGHFDYRDTLDSWHVGYSIPRDSVYKVYNTMMIKVPVLKNGKQVWKQGNELDLGNHFQNIKMYREAIYHYNLYIGNYKSKNPSAYMNRGNAYERLKIYDSAMVDYNMTLFLKPDDTIANFNKGCVYDILGKHDSAVKQYDTVIIKDVRLAKAYYNRGASFYYVGKKDNTIADFEKAITLNPTYRGELGPKLSRLKATGKLY